MRVLYGGGALLAIVATVVAGTTWLAGESDANVARVRLAATNGSEARGVAFFEQESERITGFVVVWGLEPHSEHAVHFHGPNSSCGENADPVAVHPDLKADGDGVAYTNVDLASGERLLSGGFYYNVHAGPSRDAENPEIACGDID